MTVFEGPRSIRYRVDRGPSKTVKLVIRCGQSCVASVDVTQHIASAPRGRWRTLNIPLALFETQGGELAEIDSPFAMTTDGVLGLTISEIELKNRTLGSR